MRTHRITAALLAVVALTATACGSSVTVEVATEGPDGEPQPQANLPLDFLPFDRDSVFDVLDAAAETPRPEMGEELRAAHERVASLQAEWRDAETEWTETRDELRNLRQRLDQIDPRDPGYRPLYDQFGQLEAREAQLDRQRKAAFDSFTAAQAEVSTRLDSFRVALETWENDAYAGYYDIDQGRATVSLPGGDWWVTARAPVLEGEIYWNVPVPDTDTLRLDASNGTVRPRL
jgi:TolA-binding protein